MTTTQQPTTSPLFKPGSEGHTPAAAALAFAEAGKSAVEKRAFVAPVGYRRLTINLPEALHKKLRLVAVERDTTATQIVEQLLIKELGGS